MAGSGDRTSAPVHTMSVEVSISGRGAQTLSYRAVQAGFGGAVPRGKELAFAAAAPQDGCSSVAAVPPGALLLVRRGGCYFSAKLENAAAAGASGVVLTNDKQEGYFQMESQEDEQGLEQVREGAGRGVALGVGFGGVALVWGRR